MMFLFLRQQIWNESESAVTDGLSVGIFVPYWTGLISFSPASRVECLVVVTRLRPGDAMEMSPLCWVARLSGLTMWHPQRNSSMGKFYGQKYAFFSLLHPLSLTGRFHFMPLSFLFAGGFSSKSPQLRLVSLFLFCFYLSFQVRRCSRLRLTLQDQDQSDCTSEQHSNKVQNQRGKPSFTEGKKKG